MSAVSIDRKQLNAALATLSRVAKRSPNHVAKNVLIEPMGVGCSLRLTATDLETWVSVGVDVSGGTLEGPAVVALAPLAKVVRAEKGASIGVELTGDILRLHGSISVIFPLVELGEFPQTPATIEGGVYAGEVQHLDAKTLAADIGSVISAASTDSTRYNLNGVHIVGSTFVATDGHRLHVQESSQSALIPNRNAGVILPLSAASDLARLCTSTPGTVSVWLEHEKTLFVQSGTWGFVAHLIDAEYPNYRQVMRAGGGELKAEVSRVSMLAAISALVSASTVKRSDEVKGSLRFGDDAHPLTCYAELLACDTPAPSVDVGLNRCDTGIGRIGFNLRYLKDALESLTSDYVVFRFHAPDGKGLPADRAVQIEPDRFGFETVRVVMPLRVG